MKKSFLMVLLATVIAVSLCACGGRSGKKPADEQGIKSIKSAVAERVKSNEQSDGTSVEKEDKEEKEDLATVSEAAYLDFLAKKNMVSYTGRDLNYVKDGHQFEYSVVTEAE